MMVRGARIVPRARLQIILGRANLRPGRFDRLERPRREPVRPRAGRNIHRTSTPLLHAHRHRRSTAGLRGRTAQGPRRLHRRRQSRPRARRSRARPRQCGRARRPQRDHRRRGADGRRAETSGDCPRRNRRRQRRRARCHRARHRRHERAWRQQRQRRRARARADAVAGAIRAGRGRDHEERRVGQEEADRHRAARQDARPRRPRPHRPGSRGALPRRSAWTSSRTIRSSPSRSPARWASSSSTSMALCARADYISLHIPATPETRHLFDAERLAKCKPTPASSTPRAAS